MSALIVTREVVICNPLGLHMRPAGIFVQKAQQFQSEIKVFRSSYSVDAKSIIDVVTLGAAQGTQLLIQAEGPDAQAAVDALAELVENSFGLVENAE